MHMMVGSTLHACTLHTSMDLHVHACTVHTSMDLHVHAILGQILAILGHILAASHFPLKVSRSPVAAMSVYTMLCAKTPSASDPTICDFHSQILTHYSLSTLRMQSSGS